MTSSLPFVADISLQPGDIVFATDERGRLVFWNNEAESITGRASEEVLGKPYTLACGMSLSDVDLSAVLAGRDHAGGARCRGRSGQEIALYLYATRGRNEAADATGVIFVARDVTDLWRVEETARVSADKYRLLFEHTLDSVAIADLEGRVLEANPACLRLYGYTAEEVTQVNLIDVVAPEDRELAAKAMSTLSQGNSVQQRALKMLRKDGTGFVVELAAYVVTLGGEKRIFSVTRDVTERSRADAALRESEERYRAIFETASDAVFVEAVDGRILDVNRHACELLGYRRGDLLKMSVADLVPSDARAWLPHVTDTLLRDGVFRGEAVNVHKDGHQIPVEISLARTDLGSGTVVLAIVRDITERVRADRELREEKERSQTYLALAGVILVALDKTGRISLLNRKGCKVLAVTEEEVLGRNWFDNHVPERNREEVRRTFESLMSGDLQGAEYYENPVLTAEGKERLVAWHNSILRDERGRPIGTISSGEDVTERVTITKRLQETEEQYRRLVEMSPDGIVVHQDGKVVLINPAGAKLLGYGRPEEVIGQPVLGFVHPDEVAGVKERIRRVLREGKHGEAVQERFRREDGSSGEVEVVSAPFYWRGRPAVLVVLRDVSEREQLLRTAQETTDGLRAVLDNSPEALAGECDGTLVYANQRFALLFGYGAPTDVIGRPMGDFHAPGDRALLVEYSRLRKQGRDAPTSYSFQGLKRDGTVAPMEASVSTYSSHGDLHILASIREVLPTGSHR